MMGTKPMLIQEECHAKLEKIWSGIDSTAPLYRMRAKAWNRYKEIGLPDRKNELFRYVPIHRLFAKDLVQDKHDSQINPEQYTLPECQGACLVFVNGSYRKELSQTDQLPFVVSPLSEAVNTYNAFIGNQWEQNLNLENDPFAALNGALFGEGLFVYVPPKTAVETPVEIVHIIDVNDEQVAMMHPRIHLFIGRDSELKIVRTEKRLSGQHTVVNGAFHAALEENSSLHYTHSVLDASPTSWYLDSLRIHQKRDSRLNTIQVTDGSETCRHDYKVWLNGENAEARLNGLMMLAEERQAHANILIEHVAPHCTSYQLFKNALNDSSHSSFEGKIYVHQEAQKTEAYQLNNNLLMSNDARADSKPNLEIFADDVKASHGSTVGQLDEEQLFYLMARGFSRVEAQNLLIYGFCKEVIDMISMTSLHKEVTERAKRYLKKG